jgi:hypothetical protein
LCVTGHFLLSWMLFNAVEGNIIFEERSGPNVGGN